MSDFSSDGALEEYASMARMITASLRATATAARLNPILCLTFRPQTGSVLAHLRITVLLHATLRADDCRRAGTYDRHNRLRPTRELRYAGEIGLSKFRAIREHCTDSVSLLASWSVMHSFTILVSRVVPNLLRRCRSDQTRQCGLADIRSARAHFA